MILLKASNLVKIYGPRRVVDHVSFEVGHREVIGLLGRNGAGKTTTFRMVMGMVVPDEGHVMFDGFDITKLPMFQRGARGWGTFHRSQAFFRGSPWSRICWRFWKRRGKAKASGTKNRTG